MKSAPFKSMSPAALQIFSLLEVVSTITSPGARAGAISERSSRLAAGLAERFSASPAVKGILETVTGVFLISLLLFVPEIGQLPRIGVRLIFLIALVGFGAYVRTTFGAQPGSSTTTP